MDHSTLAAQLFLDGYSCSQAVAAAFSDVTGVSPQTSARMVSAFGGGLSRLREVCGAVSGMAFVLGILYGYDRPEDEQGKKELYRLVQTKYQRGMTCLTGKGMYTGHTYQVMMTVVKPAQVADYKKFIRKVDPEAFVIVNETHDVLGRGFKEM